MNQPGGSLVNQILGDKFRILKKVGEGGMGAVYLGEHMQIGKKVAVKILHAHHIEDEIKVKRFFREARVAAAIGHRNIIDVYDVGVSKNGEPYLVMEYLEGESLASLLERKGVFDVAQTCAVMTPVIHALEATHEKGVVHRDLKPENIFLVPTREGTPEVKIIDFGISKFAEAGGTEKLTMPGYVVGTPAYMSPEQAGGEDEVDERTDIFSLGVIFYELLTGYLPFDGDSNNRIIYNLLYLDPIPPRSSNPDLPKSVDKVIMHALAKEPAERFQSASEIREAFDELGVCEGAREKLKELGADIERLTIAGGDLGDTRATRRRGMRGSEATVAVASSHISERVVLKLKLRSRLKKALLYAGIALACLVGLGAGVLFVSSYYDQQGDDAEADQIESSDRKFLGMVEITVQGMPPGARIFRGTEEIEGNPFSLPRQFNMVSFRVEVEGYESARFGVVPSENRTILLQLTPTKQ